MPWCEGCARFWNPNSMGTGGQCPTCGTVIAAPPDGIGADLADPGLPWHFKLLVAATVAYLGFRAWQGLAWVVEHL